MAGRAKNCILRMETKCATPMKDLPVLKNGTLVLRAIRDDDTDALFRLFREEAVTRYMDIDSFASITQATELIRFLRQKWRKGQSMRLAITLRGQDKLIGTIGLHHIQLHHYKAELGYELLPAYWGQGIMTNALDLLLQYAYGQMDLNRIEAFVEPTNEPSLKLLLRLGFHYEGRLRDNFHEKGRFTDALLYSLLRKDYEQISIWA
ncbi:GNAT family N-acetyltransferase [Chitinophaga parva]|uniref:GNAT family N-acetyltransferase n=2 Tax=Chitinophaga parva TaxID=2169414 RepID=A0A2T7BJ16_9BACT|nr:GNAT family N-acetyltransferase [Chitinophaga parva]